MEHITAIIPIILKNALDDAFIFTKSNVLGEKNDSSYDWNLLIASMYLKKYLITNYRDNPQGCSSTCFEIYKSPPLCDRFDLSIFDLIHTDHSDDKYDVLIKICEYFRKKTYDIDIWFCTWAVY
jgi:hypothetical protein